MSPGERTEPEYAIRVVGDGEQSWVLRDEYGDHDEIIGTQQLKPDGWWTDWHAPGAEPWNGDPDMPTSRSGFRGWGSIPLKGSPILPISPPVTPPAPYGSPPPFYPGGRVWTTPAVNTSASANPGQIVHSTGTGKLTPGVFQDALDAMTRAGSVSASQGAASNMMVLSPSTYEWLKKNSGESEKPAA